MEKDVLRPTVIAPGDASSAALEISPQTTEPSTPGQGAVWFDDVGKTPKWFINGRAFVFQGSTGSQVGTNTVANTTTETALVSGNPAFTAPASFFKVGRTIRICARGFWSRGASTHTIRLRVKFGSTTFLDSGPFDPNVGGTITNRGWRLDADLTCNTVGAGGTFWPQGEFAYNDDSVSTFQRGRLVMLANTATTSYDTTASNALNLTAQWGTASAANTITCSNATAECIA
jgi:hypothetical protein